MSDECEWLHRLLSLPGLNEQEKRRARVFLLKEAEADRPLYFRGANDDQAAAIMRELHRPADKRERNVYHCLIAHIHVYQPGALA